MARFTVIPLDTFKGLAYNAGVLTTKFDIRHPERFTEADVLTATKGGLQVNCKATYSDLGEDVDNCPNNTKELKQLEGWDCSISTTAIDVSKEVVRLALGAADINANTGAIVPRRDLKQSDFRNNVTCLIDKPNGGYICVILNNALSTEGFSLQTGKNAKGELPLTLAGHYSIKQQKVVPMVIYSIDEDEYYEGTTDTFTGDGTTTEFTLTHNASRFFGVTVDGTELAITAYSISSDGSTITLDTAPANDAVVKMDYTYDNATYLTSTENFTGDGSTTTFALANVANAITSVKVNNTTIDSSLYALDSDGTTVTFNTAPASTSAIVITYTYKAE